MHSFEFFFLFGVIIVSFGTQYLLCKLSASKPHQRAAATCCFSASSPTTSDRHPHSLLLPHLPLSSPIFHGCVNERLADRTPSPTFSTTDSEITEMADERQSEMSDLIDDEAFVDDTSSDAGTEEGSDIFSDGQDPFYDRSPWFILVGRLVIGSGVSPPLTPPHHTHCDTGWDGRSGADGGLLRGRRRDWKTGNRVRKPWNFFLFLPLKAMIGIREESSKSGQEESGVPHLSWSVISERFFALPPTAVITHRIHPNW